ncbi:uncharacterized protein LOC127552836 [Antechinus flavipes]|uniref:uncharacterized protein LOC127552836 n=1 Tax=Antechinus flavipes TaxID=38775 RepID=UPI002235BEFA|nr:uncharacterized protein LOC127552836 [Antechinus flavipes]
MRKGPAPRAPRSVCPPLRVPPAPRAPGSACPRLLAFLSRVAPSAPSPCRCLPPCPFPELHPPPLHSCLCYPLLLFTSLPLSPHISSSPSPCNCCSLPLFTSLSISPPLSPPCWFPPLLLVSSSTLRLHPGCPSLSPSKCSLPGLHLPRPTIPPCAEGWELRHQKTLPLALCVCRASGAREKGAGPTVRSPGSPQPPHTWLLTPGSSCGFRRPVPTGPTLVGGPGSQELSRCPCLAPSRRFPDVSEGGTSCPVARTSPLIPLSGLASCGGGARGGCLVLGFGTGKLRMLPLHFCLGPRRVREEGGGGGRRRAGGEFWNAPYLPSPSSACVPRGEGLGFRVSSDPVPGAGASGCWALDFPEQNSSDLCWL